METRQPADATLLNRQSQLLRTTLLILIAYGVLIGSLNLTLFSAGLIGIFNLSTAALAAANLWFYRKTGRLAPASWMTVAILAGMLCVFIALSNGANYSLLWVTILPPIAFFLLGSRWGAWVTAAFFAGILFYVGHYYPGFQPEPFTLATLFNFLEVMTALWLLYRYSERSREEAYERLQKISQTDALTGLWNRARLDEELLQSLGLARRNGSSTALLMIDLDHFKAINDRHGHLVGDQVLVQVAKLLRSSVRQSDCLGRWGGEEFVVLCPDTGREGAIRVAEKIRRVIEETEFTKGLRLSVSIGVATAASAASPAALLEQADENLYIAKAGGRNQVSA